MTMAAPWSNQRISAVVRIGACFFVLCGVLALAATIFLSIVQGVRDEDLWFAIVMVPAILYFVWLFGHAAWHGRAPAGWLPSWRK
jgi:hypothetical protein